jgi:hypothetical protein
VAVASVALAGTVLTGTATASNIGTQGCTPGYWKNHTDNWEEYAPSTKVSAVFAGAPAPYANLTLEQALALKGGSGLDGSTEILLRAAVAAVLNAAHEGLGYPYRRFDQPLAIIATVNAALTSGTAAR